MNHFEKPNFSHESNKSEQMSVNLDFLQEQIRFPREQWDEKFRQLIEAKIRENQSAKENIDKDEIEESPEILRERTFKRYVKGLGLSEDDLRGKRVLDLGCGNGEFVQYLIERGITREAYGIDLAIDEATIEDRFKPYLIKGNFEENFPVQNIDYVVSVGAVSSGVRYGEEIMNIRRIIENSLKSLNENGEIRIYSMKEAAEATLLEGLRLSQKKWEELLKEISATQKVEYKIKPIDIEVSGKDNDIILESVLVIRRKYN
jgi:SAM-dependent methyltransferase